MNIGPGDIVNVTLRGVRVVGIKALTGEVSTIADEHDREYPVPPQAAVERIVTADWPPLAGDLWRELKNGGGLWFIFRDPSVMNPSQSGLRAREANGDRWTDDAHDLLRDCAPLELVHRETPPGMRCPHRDLDDPTRCPTCDGSRS